MNVSVTNSEYIQYPVESTHNNTLVFSGNLPLYKINESSGYAKILQNINITVLLLAQNSALNIIPFVDLKSKFSLFPRWSHNFSCSSNKPLILRRSCNVCPHCLALIASPQLRLVPASMLGKWAFFVSQVRWKERRKGEEGALNFYNLLRSPKGPNKWCNIPFFSSSI